MKTNILTILATLLFAQIYAARVIENPYFECRTSAIPKVTKIELNNTETKLYLRCTFIPNWWIEIDDETTIKNSNGDEVYTITSLEGGELNTKLKTPECGYQDLVLHFDAIDKGITEIDFGGDSDGWKICNIDLTGKVIDRWDSPLPEELHGNWSDVTGCDGWCYGFYEDCAIVDNVFWKYRTVEKLNDSYIINLKSGKARKSLYVKREGNELAIRESANPKSRYTTEKPRFNTRGQSTSDIDPLKSGKMVLNGYIEGYSPLSDLKTGLLYYNNNVTGERLQSLITVDERGRFSITVDLPHAQDCFITLGDFMFSLLATPNDTLSFYFSYEGMLKKRLTSGFYIPSDFRVMGDQERFVVEMNDLYDYKTIGAKGSKKIYAMQKELTLTQLRDTMNSMYSIDSARLESYIAKNNFSPASVKVARNMIRNSYYDLLTVCSWMASKDNISTTESNGLVSRSSDVDLPDDYLDIVKGLEMDDKSVIMLNHFGTFMNRYLFAPFFTAYTLSTDKSLYSDSLISRLAEVQIEERVAKGRELWGDDGDFITQMTLANDFGNMVINSTPSASQAKLYMEAIFGYITEPFIRETLTKFYNQRYGIVVKGIISKPIPEGEGKEIIEQLLAPHKGKYVMVDFWGATCGPCISGIANSHDIREKLSDRDIVFMFITDKRNASEEAYNKHMAPTVGDKHHISTDEWNKLTSLFNVSGIPRYILFDKDGQVIDDHFAGWNAIELKLNELER